VTVSLTSRSPDVMSGATGSLYDRRSLQVSRIVPPLLYVMHGREEKKGGGKGGYPMYPLLPTLGYATGRGPCLGSSPFFGSPLMFKNG